MEIIVNNVTVDLILTIYSGNTFNFMLFGHYSDERLSPTDLEPPPPGLLATGKLLNKSHSTENKPGGAQ